jgi:hypothetical protein
MGLKTLDLIIRGSGCDGILIIYIDTYIHFVYLMAMVASKFFSYINPQCFPGGYATF